MVIFFMCPFEHDIVLCYVYYVLYRDLLFQMIHRFLGYEGLILVLIQLDISSGQFIMYFVKMEK